MISSLHCLIYFYPATNRDYVRITTNTATLDIGVTLSNGDSAPRSESHSLPNRTTRISSMCTHVVHLFLAVTPLGRPFLRSIMFLFIEIMRVLLDTANSPSIFPNRTELNFFPAPSTIITQNVCPLRPPKGPVTRHSHSVPELHMQSVPKPFADPVLITLPPYRFGIS